MRLSVIVTNEETRHGEKDGKPWEMTTLTVSDRSTTPRCANPMKVSLAKEDDFLKGKLLDQVIDLDVTEIKSGYKGGLIELRARVVQKPAK